MASQADVIKKFVQGLTTATKTGEDAINSALKTIGITNYKTLINNYTQTWTDGNLEMLNSNEIQKVLEQSCGIRVNNKDTGAITGSDAGGSTTNKTSESIIAEGSTAQALTDAEYNSFTKNGLTVNITYDESGYNNSNFDYDLDTYLDKQKLVVRDLYNWWIPEALDLINKSLGVNFTDGRANTNEINIKFKNYPDWNRNLLTMKVDTDMGYASNITWTINMAYLSTLTENDKNGKINEDMLYEHDGIYINNDCVERRNGIPDYFDRIVARELADMTLRANISYYDDLPSSIRLGLPRLVDGYDENIRYESCYGSYYDSTYDYYNRVYQGYTLLRYMAKQYASEIDDTTSGGSNTDTVPSGGSGADSDKDTTTGGGSGTSTQTGGSDADSGKDDDGDGLIFNSGQTAVTITADYENDAFDANDYDDLVTINASKTVYGIDITGNDNNNSIIGGKGDDTLNGGDGNDTLTGGKGEDTFVYEEYDGNDVITDYKPGEDVIEIKKGSVNDYSFKGDDVIFTVGRNTLTVKNANGTEITITDENGDTTTKTYIDNKKEAVLPLGAKYNANKTTLTLSKKFTDDEIDLSDYANTVKTITATAVKNELTITANENNNKIKVGKKATTVYGGAGNDQITGGAGADALYGEDDDDKLVGGSGADTLFGGDGDDTLTGGAGKDVFVYDGNGNDVITDYKAGQDVIQISDEVEFESVTVKGKNVTFNLDGGTLTVKNAKNKKITFVDEDGEVISNDKYKKSAIFNTDDDDDERDFVESIGEPWFAKDDNFATADVDSLLETTSSNVVTTNINPMKNFLTNSSTNQLNNDATYTYSSILMKNKHNH